MRPFIGERERLLQPAPCLGDIPRVIPEPPQRRRQTLAALHLFRVDCPAQRRTQVVVVALEPVRPGALGGADEVCFRALGKCQKPVQVALACRGPLVRSVQMAGRILPHRVEHVVAHAAVLLVCYDQRLLDQARQPVEHVERLFVAAHGLDCLQREPACEHR
jgi:hypothetical protein